MPSSLPALAAGILQSHIAWNVRPAADWFERTPLVPAYQVDPNLAVVDQPQRAAQAVLELALKLERLEDAYSNWAKFESGPYFDLYPTHAARLCRAEETRSVLRVRLYCDLLLPAFRHAERYWVETFLPAYHAGSGATNQAVDESNAFRAYLLDEAMPELARRLHAAEQAIQGTLDILSDSITVLNCLGGLEERIQHRPPPGSHLAPGLTTALQRLPRTMPTLTLDVTIPRPTWKEEVFPIDSLVAARAGS